MRKNCFLLLLIAAFLVSCESSTENALDSENLSAQEIDMSDFYVYTSDAESSTTFKGNVNSQKCSTAKELNRQLDLNPGLYKKLYNIEKHTRQFIAAKGKPDKPGGGNGGGGGSGGGETPTPYDGTVSIPVYVHVIYNTSTDNISSAQINSQITILNDDFSAGNSDFGMVPSGFSDVTGNADIQFTLAGVTRTQNPKTSWVVNNSMKYTSSGGHDAITPETHLNLWIINQFDGGTLGFAYYPGAAPEGADGVVIAHPFIGDIGTSGSLYTEFNLGRTTTHEVGHYLNLRHIWGDGRCRQDDLVSDTPSSDRANYYCPGPNESIVHCKSRDMHMNYMDYVDDACMYMFSDGQVDRMRANFATGGARESFVN